MRRKSCGQPRRKAARRQPNSHNELPPTLKRDRRRRGRRGSPRRTCPDKESKPRPRSTQRKHKPLAKRPKPKQPAKRPKPKQPAKRPKPKPPESLKS